MSKNRVEKAWLIEGLSLAEKSEKDEKGGNLIEALKCCNNAVKVNPEFSCSHASRGYTLNKMGRYDEALKI